MPPYAVDRRAAVSDRLREILADRGIRLVNADLGRDGPLAVWCFAATRPDGLLQTFHVPVPDSADPYAASTIDGVALHVVRTVFGEPA